jgi:hypothetical protein
MDNDERPPSQKHEISHPATAGEWAFTRDGDGRLARVSGFGPARLELISGELAIDGLDSLPLSADSLSVTINGPSLEPVAVLHLPKPGPADVPSSQWSALFAKVFGIDAPETPADAETAIAELFERPGHFGRFDSGAAPAAQLRALIEHSRAISGCVQLLDQQLGTAIEGELGNDEIVYELRKAFARLAALASGRDEFEPAMIAEALAEFDADDQGLQAEVIRARARWIPTGEGAAAGTGFEALPLGRDGCRAWAVPVASGVLVRVDNSAGEPAAMHFVAGETLVSMRQRFGSIDPK